MSSFDVILRGGTVCLPSGAVNCDVGVQYGTIAAIGNLGIQKAAQEINIRGLHLLPGAIDTQVHLREPGLEHKEDLQTGTRAAILGGVTSIFEMPNTSPPTISVERLKDKIFRATGRAYSDFAFYGGASHENLAELIKMENTPGCCGIKIFMGSSTGHLLLDDPKDLEMAFSRTKKRVALHAEDQVLLEKYKSEIKNPSVFDHPKLRDVPAALTATQRAVATARKLKRLIHLLHITSEEEIVYLRSAKDVATVETTPQHLTFSAPECYERLGTLAQMNPPIRETRHREALWRGVLEGTVDVIGSDHAPHTLEEKSRRYPGTPSGMTGVQTLLPLMIHHMNEGRLSLKRVVEITSQNPAQIFGIAEKGRIEVGRSADFALVDLKRTETIHNKWIASRCGWTPYDGMKIKGWVVGTFLRGSQVMREGEILTPPSGKALRFD